MTNNGYQYQYDIFEQRRAQAAGLSFPESFTCVMGNHEQMGDGTHTRESVESLHANFLERTGASSVYYDRYVGGSHVIALGPDEYVSPYDVSTTDTFKLSAAQLSWLSGLLDEDQAAGVPSFVFVHEPLQYTVTDSYPGGWGFENSLEDDADLRSVVFSHAGAILSRPHPRLPGRRAAAGGNLFVGTGSVAYAYAQGDVYLTDDGSYAPLGGSFATTSGPSSSACATVSTTSGSRVRTTCAGWDRARCAYQELTWISTYGHAPTSSPLVDHCAQGCPRKSKLRLE